MGVKVKATKVTVSTTAIEQLFTSRGAAGQAAADIGRQVAERAKAKAPRNKRGHRDGSPTLADSHIWGVQPRGFTAVTTISNISPYALFVHDGTRAVITSTRGRSTIKVGRRRGQTIRARMGPLPRFGIKSIWQPEVSGQRANPWLVEAAIEVTTSLRLSVHV